MIESGKGTRLLKKIRRNYFTDELVQLWNLLYEFFDRAEMVASGRPYHEKLLVNNFNLIFEDMVDQIISDKDVPTELKEQKDGKIVDHLYRAQSIVETEKQIYYIGDSKYYKESNNVGENSIYKQFTYAKNVIQHNINLFNEKRLPDYFRYRDDLTEGYNITPNFFIRGIIDFENPDSQDFSFKKDNAFMPTNCHFLNRLFDRDTLFLQSYDINFMFVLASYVRNSDDASLKQKLKKTFRDDFVDFLSAKFKFCKLTPRDGDLKSAVERNFKNLIGKIYKPDNANVLILALDSDVQFKEENRNLKSLIEVDFEIADYQLDKLTDKVRHISYNQPDEPLPIAADPTATYGKNS
jgi:hydroxymethylpyrimidine pyrophosphatase-like HAD family hydrolase